MHQTGLREKCLQRIKNMLLPENKRERAQDIKEGLERKYDGCQTAADDS